MEAGVYSKLPNFNEGKVSGEQKLVCASASTLFLYTCEMIFKIMQILGAKGDKFDPVKNFDCWVLLRYYTGLFRVEVTLIHVYLCIIYVYICLGIYIYLASYGSLCLCLFG